MIRTFRNATTSEPLLDGGHSHLSDRDYQQQFHERFVSRAQYLLSHISAARDNQSRGASQQSLDSIGQPSSANDSRGGHRSNTTTTGAGWDEIARRLEQIDSPMRHDSVNTGTQVALASVVNRAVSPPLAAELDALAASPGKAREDRVLDLLDKVERLLESQQQHQEPSRPAANDAAVVAPSVKVPEHQLTERQDLHDNQQQPVETDPDVLRAWQQYYLQWASFAYWQQQQQQQQQPSHFSGLAATPIAYEELPHGYLSEESPVVTAHRRVGTSRPYAATETSTSSLAAAAQRARDEVRARSPSQQSLAYQRQPQGPSEDPVQQLEQRLSVYERKMKELEKLKLQRPTWRT